MSDRGKGNNARLEGHKETFDGQKRRGSERRSRDSNTLTTVARKSRYQVQRYAMSTRIRIGRLGKQQSISNKFPYRNTFWISHLFPFSDGSFELQFRALSFRDSKSNTKKSRFSARHAYRLQYIYCILVCV